MCVPRYTVGASENSRLCSVLALKRAGFSLADVQEALLQVTAAGVADRYLYNVGLLS